MTLTAAIALTLGIALLAAALIGALAYRAGTQPAGRHRLASLSAADAADHLHPGADLGDDDQWRRWRTLVPHIRRHANAETQATQDLEGDRS